MIFNFGKIIQEVIFLDLKVILSKISDMYRGIEQTLSEWKNDAKRKPLLLIGARQTGKTYILEKFGKESFDSVIKIDFERNPNAKHVFEGNLEPESIIPQLEILTGVRFIPGKTLIILDEIQACPRALTALKYFKDSGRKLHVVGAGSLLGVAINREDFSFPVGKVKTIRLYPLDFEEFLIASGNDRLAVMCRESFETCNPLPEAMHIKLIDLYRTYIIIGGMPEVLLAYLENGSYIAAGEVQEGILSDYRSDIAKYADDSQKVLAQRAFDTIPMQLAKENRKFQYNLIRKGATSAVFGEAIEWLSAAGLTLRCVKITTPGIPLKAYEDISSFKLYLLDTGLLIRMSGMPRESILSGMGERFMGGITENYVASSFVSRGVPLYYWESSGQAEIDFVIQRGSDAVPVEVKSSEHVRSRSLSVYKNRFSPELSIRLSTRNFGLENGIFSGPLYAAWLVAESGRLS